MADTAESLKSRYARYESTRQPYLDRARDCAKLTIPSLVPPTGTSGTTKLTTPWQSLGARGVNNLAARLLMALMPPGSSFFRYAIDDITLEKMTGREGMRAEVEVALGRMERAVTATIESSNARMSVFMAAQQLLVAGNVLLFVSPDGSIKVFRLDRYVVKRDPMGHPLEIITKESLSVMELPEKLKANRAEKPNAIDDTVELFTQVLRTKDGWAIIQEVDGVLLPETAGTYPVDKCPWLALRFVKMDGEDYGRSYVEAYMGDLKTYEALRKAIVQGSAAAAKVLFLVKPNATTKHRTIAQAESGDVREGNVDDVGVLQLNKQGDFRVAAETITSLEQALSFAFLLNSSVQRNGERVTAEEIRFLASELEAQLGGIYAMLAQEFQRPYVIVVASEMERAGIIPVLPKGTVKPVITTGTEAIGRSSDLNKLKSLLEILMPLGPDNVAGNLNVTDFIDRSAAAIGIDAKGLIPTPEERQAQAEQAQMQQMVQGLGPNAINQMGNLAKQQMANDAQSQPGAVNG